jgi:hypothetical protein
MTGLMLNSESIELMQPRAHINGRLADKSVHALGDRPHESIELVWSSLGDQFDSTVGQIPHDPGHLKLLRQPPGRISEPYALNVTAV